MTDKNIRERIVEEVKKAPMLSISASKLMEITAQVDHETTEVVDVVMHDSNLTARVLKVVNSAAFGLMSPVTTIERAVTLLGERVVVGIAIGDSAGQLFNKALTGYESAGGELWKHDLRAAIASRQVAVHGKAGISADFAFTAGLLHDIGKAFLSDFMEGTAGPILEQIENNQATDYLESESELLGINHTEAGLILAEYWSLPEPLKVVIHHHHHPDQAPEEFKALTYCVHLGDIIAMMGGCGTGSDTLQYNLDPEYIRYLDLSPTQLAEVLLEVDEEFAKVSGSIAESKESPR